MLDNKHVLLKWAPPINWISHFIFSYFVQSQTTLNLHFNNPCILNTKHTMLIWFFFTKKKSQILFSIAKTHHSLWLGWGKKMGKCNSWVNLLSIKECAILRLHNWGNVNGSQNCQTNLSLCWKGNCGSNSTPCHNHKSDSSGM